MNAKSFKILLTVLFISLFASTTQAGLFSKNKNKNDPGSFMTQMYEMLPEEARNASYSGTRIITSDDQPPFEAKVYHSGLNERVETNQEGYQMIIIMNGEEGQIYSLHPEQKAYIKIPMSVAESVAESSQDMDAIQIEKVGSTTVDGIAVTHYRIPETKSKDGTFEADYYITAQGVPVKMDMKGTSGKWRKKPYRTVMELKDIKVEPQPDELFQVPDDYASMASLSGILQSASQTSAEEKAEKEKKKEKRSLKDRLRDIID